jgi:hypothetical protein
MFPFISTANPQDSSIMMEAFESHCLQHNIVDETARTKTARLIMLLFQGGATTAEDLKAGLARWRAL